MNECCHKTLLADASYCEGCPVGADGVTPIPAPGHNWHDHTPLNGRNTSRCSRCKLVVWTGEELDTPCVTMPTVGVNTPDGGQR